MMNQHGVGIWVVSPPLAAPSLRGPRARWLAFAAVFAVLLGTLLTLAAEGALRPAAIAPAVATREWPERPLPREWRWSPPTVATEHMFRTRR